MRQLLVIMVILALLISHQINADIKNGFTEEVKIARQSIANLKAMLRDAELTKAQKRDLTRRIRSFEDDYDQLMRAEKRTEEVISLLKEIDPGLYGSVSNLKDQMGNSTDIIVKVIKNLGTDNGIYGTTSLSSSHKSPHECSSIYGDHTVSINVHAGGTALQFLVHEFGHALYIVPNLKSYQDFYGESYRYTQHSETRGHKADDPSHISVKKAMRDFQAEQKKYRRMKRVRKDGLSEN